MLDTLGATIYFQSVQQFHTNQTQSDALSDDNDAINSHRNRRSGHICEVQAYRKEQYPSKEQQVMLVFIFLTIENQKNRNQFTFQYDAAYVAWLAIDPRVASPLRISAFVN